MGDFESVVRGHDTERHLGFSVDWQVKLSCELPDAIGGGSMTEGLDMRFEVQAGMGLSLTGQSLMLREMSYHLHDGRRFGMKSTTEKLGYEVFAPGGDGRTVRHRSEPPSPLGSVTRFYDFPHWALKPFGDSNIFFDVQYDLQLFLADIHHLGPLRAKPRRIYARSGVHPLDVGSAGEWVVDAIVSSRERGQIMLLDGELARFGHIEDSVSRWLKRLGLAEKLEVRPLTQNKKWYEVGISRTTHATRVAITDVGIGVSQILPVLVLCNYIPADSTLLLEQPEIHLHPSVQARLADVFIDAYQREGIQVVFESHSEHLLRRLQRRVAEGAVSEDDISLFFCSTHEHGESAIEELEVDEFGHIANWPKDFFGDQFGEVAAMSEASLSKMEQRNRQE